MIDRHYFHCLRVPDEPIKIARILYALAIRDSLHRFHALDLHDTSLNSTISSLRHDYGVSIGGRWVAVAGYRRKPTWVVRYFLDLKQDQTNAHKVLTLLTSWGFIEPPPEPTPKTAIDAA